MRRKKHTAKNFTSLYSSVCVCVLCWSQRRKRDPQCNLFLTRRCTQASLISNAPRAACVPRRWERPPSDLAARYTIETNSTYTRLCERMYTDVRLPYISALLPKKKVNASFFIFVSISASFHFSWVIKLKHSSASLARILHCSHKQKNIMKNMWILFSCVKVKKNE